MSIVEERLNGPLDRRRLVVLIHFIVALIGDKVFESLGHFALASKVPGWR
jgi:hypothetical protein